LSKNPADRPANAQWLADQVGLAIEQRRELPAALRAFVKRTGRMDGGGTVLGLGGALIAAVAVSWMAGVSVGIVTLGATLTAMPLVFGIAAAKRLLNLGFTRADLAPAFRAEQESIREEQSAHSAGSFSWRAVLERILSKTARVSGAAGLVVTPFALAGWNSRSFAQLGSVVVVLFSVTALSAFCLLFLVQMRRDVDIEFWNAVWTGRFGQFAFAVARKLRGAKPMRAAATHRATELSLGLAAEELFINLPKATRQSLGDVPAMLQRLQHDAHRLRLRHDKLQDALARAGSDSTSDDYAEVRSERDAMYTRMCESVKALETVRLGLLRLHAGTLSLEGLTTHLNLAADTSADVERLIVAHAEVDAMLCIPNRIELTPV
jgi:hypothetical protein